MASLEITNLKKSYGNIEILKGIDLVIKDREFVVFVGPSGCGKSTLLRSIAGLEEISSGDILLDDKDISQLAPAKRDLSMVFQSYALYPHMSVRDNMSFALKLAGEDKQVIADKVAKASRILELDKLLERKPKELSGGQRQRVAIGRSIVRHPKVFLFDEPLSNLDAALRVQMRLELARLHKQLNATMVYVTHDQVEAMTLADKVVVMNEGRIEQIGSPLSLYQHPINKFVAGFLGMPKMSFLKVEVISDDDEAQQSSSQSEQDATVDKTCSIDVLLSGDYRLSIPLTRAQKHKVHSGQQLTLGVRPEHVKFCEDSSSALTVQIDAYENLGSDTFCYIKTPTQEMLTVRASGAFSAQESDRKGLVFDAEHCHLFDQQGLAL